MSIRHNGQYNISPKYTFERKVVSKPPQCFTLSCLLYSINNACTFVLKWTSKIWLFSQLNEHNSVCGRSYTQTDLYIGVFIYFLLVQVWITTNVESNEGITFSADKGAVQHRTETWPIRGMAINLPTALRNNLNHSHGHGHPTLSIPHQLAPCPSLFFGKWVKYCKTQCFSAIALSLA